MEVEKRLRDLPKVELHQHVDGSIPPAVTWELMKAKTAQPRGEPGGAAPAPGAAGRRGRNPPLLPRQDALPALDHPVLREHHPGHGGDRGGGGRRRGQDPRAALLARDPYLRRAHAAAVHPRRALGNEPREQEALHEARPRGHRHAAARAPHREDPGPPGHLRGATPPRAHRGGGLRHRRPRARQPPPPLQELLPDRAPRAPRVDGARRRGRPGRVRVGGGGRAGGAADRPRVLGRRRSRAAAPPGPGPHRGGVLLFLELPHGGGETRAAASDAGLPGGGRARGPLLRQHDRLAHRSGEGEHAGGRSRGAGDGGADPPRGRRLELHPARDGAFRHRGGC